MLVLDEIIGKAYKLDGNELCVYSHIAKYKEKGWFSTYQRMTELLPIVVSTKTVERAVKKLTALGLIERRNGVLFTTTNCPPSADKLSPTDRQNVLSKQTNCPSQTDKLSPIYKENKKREEEINLACESIATPNPSTPSSFDLLLAAYKAHKGNVALPAAKIATCRELWDNKTPTEQQRLLQELNNGNYMKDTLEWTIKDYHMPQPKNYNGDMSVDVTKLAKTTPMVIAFYEGVAGLYTRKDAEDYQMDIRNDFA